MPLTGTWGSAPSRGNSLCKGLRQDPAWFVGETAKRSVWLEQGEEVRAVWAWGGLGFISREVSWRAVGRGGAAADSLAPSGGSCGEDRPL